MSGAVPAPGFGASHAVLQRQVDGGLLAGASAAVWRHGALVDHFCTGWADLERGEPLRPDHIHRSFSNTKLVTAVLVLGLVDEGVLALDEPLKRWLPAFGALRVMRPGAASIDDTEPLARDLTLRHLLSHQAGFGHGVFDPGSPLYRAYAAADVLGPQVSLAQQAERLAALPLAFQPGEGWEYSFAPDLLARVAEVATGQRFGALLHERLFGPLGMVDTGFVLRPDQRPRLAALYRGHRDDPLRPGLKRLEATPWPDAYRVPVARESAAGGLFTTQADMLALLGALLASGHAGGLLAPATWAQALRDQLPPQRCVQFPFSGPLPHLGHALLGAVARAPSALAPAAAVGELQWGGLAGTHWWLHPGLDAAGVVMTQRFMGFWHPFWFEYRRALYVALGAADDGPRPQLPAARCP